MCVGLASVVADLLGLAERGAQVIHTCHDVAELGCGEAEHPVGERADGRQVRPLSRCQRRMPDGEVFPQVTLVPLVGVQRPRQLPHRGMSAMLDGHALHGEQVGVCAVEPRQCRRRLTRRDDDGPGGWWSQFDGIAVR